MIDMKTALEEMRNDLIDEIKSRLLTAGNYPHKASGNLERSLEAAKQTPITQNKDGQWQLIFNVDKTLIFIDQGRRPGKYAPIQPLINWINTKGLVIEKGTPKSVAFAISKKIFKHGINTINSRLDGPNGKSAIIQPSIIAILNKYMKQEGSSIYKASKQEVLDFVRNNLIGFTDKK